MGGVPSDKYVIDSTLSNYPTKSELTSSIDTRLNKSDANMMFWSKNTSDSYITSGSELRLFRSVNYCHACCYAVPLYSSLNASNQPIYTMFRSNISKVTYTIPNTFRCYSEANWQVYKFDEEVIYVAFVVELNDTLNIYASHPKSAATYQGTFDWFAAYNNVFTT